MRSSSVRTVTFALAGLALAPALLIGLGCGPTEQPAPKKVDQQSPFERDQVRRKPDRDPNDPLRDPSVETPRGRDGEQISAEQIDAVLAEAGEAAKVENHTAARNILRRCANKTPASARCDGQMGLSLITAKSRRATALYYLREAALVDDPKADAAMYVAIGEALRKYGQLEPAIAATQKGVDREPSAEHLYALGRLLSLVPERLTEAANQIALARAQDDRIEWLYEEAVIRGQVPVREQAAQAIELFDAYITRAKLLAPESLPGPLEPLEARVAELTDLLERYPTQAEFDKAQAADPTPASDPAAANPT